MVYYVYDQVKTFFKLCKFGVFGSDIQSGQVISGKCKDAHKMSNVCSATNECNKLYN